MAENLAMLRAIGDLLLSVDPGLLKAIATHIGNPHIHNRAKADLRRIATKQLKALSKISKSGFEIGLTDLKLIAAAPDLLAALIGVVRVADRDTVEFDAARAAIAKATA